MQAFAESQAAGADSSESAPADSEPGHSPAEKAADWNMHSSSRGGYSFRAPPDWLEETNEGPGNLAVYPPVRQKVDMISFGYMTFEKSEDEDLIEWLERYYALGFGPEISREIVPAELNVKTSGGDSQQAAFRYGGPARGHGFYITNGRLVLMVTTSSLVEAHEELMRTVVESIEFRADAPTTMKELWYPQEPPMDISIEEYMDGMQVMNDASAALNVRLQTGEDPAEMLTSDAVRQHYEQLLVMHSRDIEGADQHREWLEQPRPTPDPNRDTSVYEEKEREYNQRLMEQASSPLVLPTPTATPAARSPLREPDSSGVRKAE